MKTINVVAGIIKKDNKIFIAERGYGEFKEIGRASCRERV